MCMFECIVYMLFLKTIFIYYLTIVHKYVFWSCSPFLTYSYSFSIPSELLILLMTFLLLSCLFMRNKIFLHMCAYGALLYMYTDAHMTVYTHM